ncbi:MAG: O-antigen ligase family protein [Terricaulis silvestris]
MDPERADDRPGFGAFATALFFLILPAAATAGAMALAVLQGVFGVLATPLRNLRPRSALNWAFLISLLAFVAYVCATSLWSRNPNHAQAWRLSAGVACGLLFAAGAAANDGGRRLTRAVGVAAIAVTAAMLLGEAFANMPLNRIGQPHTETGLLMRNPARGASVLMCLTWAGIATLAAGSSFQRLTWRGIMVATGVLAFQFDQSANAIAFGFGLIAYVLAYSAPRLTIMGLCAGLAAWLIAAPWVILHAHIPAAFMARLPDSWAIRTSIWQFASTQIEAHPVLGLGLDSARTFPQIGHIRNLTFNLIPLHPHSASLQIWLETGVVGAVLGALCLLIGGAALSSALRQDRLAAAAAAGTIACIGLIANVSYGAWQEWWVATAFAAAALVSATRRHVGEDED